MAEHKVRRLPVIDGQSCVGIIGQADIATQHRRGEGRRPGRGDLRRTLIEHVARGGSRARGALRAP